MHLPRVLLLLLALALPSGLAAEVKEEKFAKGADSAQDAYRTLNGGRVGILLVCTERSPDLGFRYAGRGLLSEKRQLEGDPHRMPEGYELRLYEELRRAFRTRGYEALCLNRREWRGLRLKEILDRLKHIREV